MIELHGWYLKRHYGGGGKSGPSAPPPPDYRGAAMEQSAASKELTAQQNFANRPTLNTPWGQQTWGTSAGVDPATGTPVTNWTSNINLTQEGQDALDAQQRISAGRSEAAETLLPQAISNFQNQMNWDNLPWRPSQAADVSSFNATNAVAGDVTAGQQGAYQRLSAMVQPQRDQERESMEVRLANMGIPRNSEAWNRAMTQLSGQWAGQDEKLLNQAMNEGRTDVLAQFGMERESMDQAGRLQGQDIQQRVGYFDQQARMRQQAVAEEAMRRGMTLNELNALLTGQQVNMPQMPNFQPATKADAPNLLGAATAQGNYNMNAAQLEAQGGNDWGSGIAGIASLASTGAKMGLFSDIRLKSNIKRIGTHKVGVGIYSYEIFGRPEIGVLAQELISVRPDLVTLHPSGYFMVNYGGLQ